MNHQKTMVRCLFIIQGCACLLPFNVLINCPDYFLSLYFPSIMTIISAVNLVPNLIGLFFMTFIGHRLHFCIVFILPYVLFILSLILIPILGCWMKHIPLLIITLLLIFVCGCCTSILQGAVFGKTNLFPDPTIIQGVMFGIGVVGVFISILRIVTKCVMSSNSQYVYFFLGASLMLVFMLSFWLTYCIPYAKQFLFGPYENIVTVVEKNALKEHGGIAIHLFFIFLVTISVFPGISSVIPSTLKNHWFPVIMTTVFTVFDFLGRTLPRFLTLKNRYTVYVCTWSRIILIPLFLLCWTLPLPHFIHWGYNLFANLLMAWMGFSNGYLSTLLVMFHNQSASKTESSGTFMMFSMSLGIASGSLLSIGFYHALFFF